jgi:hypothetical protein
MKSYPSWDQVRADLGDKVVDGVVTAVAATRRDLQDYRRGSPRWVAESTERGLASWIHDRLWIHLVPLIDGVANVDIIDQEPRREITLGYTYRMRLKRHHEDGHVRSYPTQAALEFFAQPGQGVLDGLEEVHLMAGYVWNRELREMQEPVFSLRDGARVIWEVRLDEPSAGEAGTPMPALPEPPTPRVDGPSRDVEQTDDGE